MNQFIAEVLRDSGMLSLEQGMNLYFLLSQVLLNEVEGEVVELGCCHGNTAILMQKTLDLFASNKNLHVFDSFQGLPKKHNYDYLSPLEEGGCNSNPGILKRRFEKFNTKLPYIHIGWFHETLAKQLPMQICFAHVDGDFYDSTMQSLTNLYDRLAPGAVVVLDDYCNEEDQLQIHDALNQNKFKLEAEQRLKDNPNICPGVKKACDEFFVDKPEQVTTLLSGYAPHGYFKKL